jgi:hypothetical protein
MHLTGPMALNAPTNSRNMYADFGAVLSEFRQMKKSVPAGDACCSLLDDLHFCTGRAHCHTKDM